MQLTIHITATQAWLLLQLLSTLAQIIIAVGVLAWYCECRRERRLEVSGRDVPDLITFEDEFPSASPTTTSRHHRVPEGRLGGRHTLSGIDGFRPRFHWGGFTPASCAFLRPCLCYERSRESRHRRVPADADFGNESEISESGAMPSTSLREESVRSSSAGYPETDGLRLPKPQRYSRECGRFCRASAESEVREGKPGGGIAKSKGKRKVADKSKDDGRSTTPTSNSGSLNAHAPKADGPSNRSREGSAVSESPGGSATLGRKPEGSIAHFNNKGKTDRRRRT